MPLDWLAAALAALALAALAVGSWAVVRHAGRSRSAEALDRGDFDAALEALSDTGDEPERDELLAAAVAAKHLLELDRAETLLARLLAADPGDGEAWLERGLVAAYAGQRDEAEAALERAVALRSDLAESIALHRAWLALAGGDAERARRLFEEIEAPLATKLTTDLGPGDPLFCEWFLQAADLWRAAGDHRRADWCREQGLASAPGSALARRLGGGPPEG